VRARYSHGNLSGHTHNNLILYTRVYEVKFGDGTRSYVNDAANVIAESIDAIVDHNSKSAVTYANRIDIVF